jgi:hypothetical protein
MFKGKKKDNMPTSEMLQLAKAMSRLADSLDKFQDPLWWQKAVGASLQTTLQYPQIREALPTLPFSLSQVIVTLSEEERQDLASKVYEKLKPQLTEFNGFVKASLVDLPPNRLKELAQRIESGEKLQLKRRRGCVYVSTDGGGEVYLNL